MSNNDNHLNKLCKLCQKIETLKNKKSGCLTISLKDPTVLFSKEYWVDLDHDFHPIQFPLSTIHP